MNRLDPLLVKIDRTTFCRYIHFHLQRTKFLVCFIVHASSLVGVTFAMAFPNRDRVSLAEAFSIHVVVGSSLLLMRNGEGRIAY
jgi:hypothetical protein